MLDFDAGKLLIIGLVALVVIGPKDLPRVLRQVGQAVAKLRRMAGEFQGQFMDAMKEADLQDIKAELAKIKDNATLDVDFDPVRDVKEHVTGALDTAPPTAPPLMTGTADAGLSGFELPRESGLEPAPADALATVAASPEPGHPADHASALAVEPLPAGDLAEAVPMPDIHPGREDGTAAGDAGHPAARRRIVVTRRRRLSRLDGPTLRAAVLIGHSRNIRPARRGTTEP